MTFGGLVIAQNMPGYMPIVIGVVIVAVIGGAILAHLAAKKRREELQALASELGMRFEPRHDGSHDDEYAHFEIFRRGHSRSAYNTLYGSLEIDGRRYTAKAGDFRYKRTSGSGKNRRTSTYHFSYLILHLPWHGIPDLLIRPEGMFDKLAGAFGFDDIDFESEEFSRKFHVKSPDRRFAFDVCHTGMMEFLLQAGGPTIDIEHGRCCTSDGSRRWSPQQFRAHIGFLRRFFSLWPEHLVAQIES